MSHASKGAGAAIVSALVAACASPPPSDELLSEPVTITQKAPNTDFSVYRTFFIRPTIANVTDSSTTATVDASIANPILDAIKKNMTDRGYKEAANKSDADLEMQSLYLNTISSTAYCYSWYDPYYWGYPAYSYYPYYGGCSSTVWRSGMLVTVIVDATKAVAHPTGLAVTLVGDAGQPRQDAAKPPGSTQLPGVWASAVYAIALDSGTAIQGINESFTQSPYLTARSSGGTQ